MATKVIKAKSGDPRVLGQEPIELPSDVKTGIKCSIESMTLAPNSSTVVNVSTLFEHLQWYYIEDGDDCQRLVSSVSKTGDYKARIVIHNDTSLTRQFTLHWV